jgi:hypothetical protein
MSCTCNKSKTCDPCAFCSPPGVTCLTTCEPVDPCENKIDLSCVVYSGNVTSFCNVDPRGQTLYSLLLKVFTQSFGDPFTACCLLQGSIELITTTTTSTTSTTTTSTTTSTTSTTSTTTTTTRSLACYRLVNSNQNSIIVTYSTNAGWNNITVPGSGTLYVCSYAVTPQTGLTITNMGACSVSYCQPTTTTTTTSTTTTSTTTTTTTIAPVSNNCYCISLYNNSSSDISISYTDNKGCLGKPGAPIPLFLKVGEIYYTCATLADLTSLPSTIIRTIVSTSDCSIASGCQLPRSTCNTLTASGGSVGYTYYNGYNIKTTATLVAGATTNVCGWGITKVSGSGVLNITSSNNFCITNADCNKIGNCNCFSIANSSNADFKITYNSCEVGQTTLSFILSAGRTENFCANGLASSITSVQVTNLTTPARPPIITLQGPCSSSSACAF